LVQEIGWLPPTTYEFALNAQHERGFFGYLTISIRKYLCRDPELRKQIEEHVEYTRQAGYGITSISPEWVVGSAGLALGSLLVQSIPVLALVGAPVIAGLVVIIYTIGIDAFCQWAANQGERTVDVEQ
jgi:hypothetical protein